MGAAEASESASAAARGEEELLRKLKMPISDLELSVRANNCLESTELQTVADLVANSETDLLKVRSFGKTSLREVKRKLTELGLSLDMEIPREVQTGV